MKITNEFFKEKNYRHTLSDKKTCHNCKNSDYCEELAVKFKLRIDRFHTCDKIIPKGR